MTPTAQQKFARKMRLAPKVWICYLVGYRSSNIYRIWIPTMDRVINTRDVIFNEEVFDGDWKNFQDELLEADVQKIAEFIQNHSMAEDEGMTEPDDEDVMETDALPVTDMADVNGNQESKETDATQEDAEKQSPYIPARFAPYPTPPQSPPSALLAHTIQPMPLDEPVPKEEGDKTIPRQAAFLAELKAAPTTKVNSKILDKAKMERLLRQGVKLHRNLLPAPPKWHQDLENHPLGT
jgi:hypothetical protein